MLVVTSEQFSTGQREPKVDQSGPPLEVRVIACLRRTHSQYLRQISCEAHEGVVTLQGSVPAPYLKQIAEEIVLSVEGVVRVRNELEVGRHGLGLDCPLHRKT
ncbi:MAG: BON domain-containing protein [Thermoguttaceae bacterium]